MTRYIVTAMIATPATFVDDEAAMAALSQSIRVHLSQCRIVVHSVSVLPVFEQPPQEPPQP